MRRLLAYIFLLSSSAFQLFAYDVEVDGICYELFGKSSAYVTHRGTNGKFEPGGYAGDIVVPEQIQHGGNTYKVIAIGPSAFADCPELTSVRLSSTVRGISACAFLGCPKLRQVICSGPVSGIAACAFAGCTALQQVTLPRHAEFVDTLALYCCATLSTVVLPHRIRTVCHGALQHLPQMTDLYVFASLPPRAEQGSFTLSDQKQCVLHVPAEAIALYQESPVWREFCQFVPLTDEDYMQQGYQRGDINDDGRVDADDLNMLRRLIVRLPESAAVRWAADINGDGKVNGADYVLLAQKLSAV